MRGCNLCKNIILIHYHHYFKVGVAVVLWVGGKQLYLTDRNYLHEGVTLSGVFLI
jgi:hypothetical protein